MTILPGETILHVNQRLHGSAPQSWRLMAAANNLRDPFQAADSLDTYTPAAGLVLQPYMELRNGDESAYGWPR